MKKNKSEYFSSHVFTFPRVASPVWKYGLLEKYHSLEELWNVLRPLFDRDFINNLRSELEKIERFCEEREIRTLKITDPGYPKSLKEIHSPPIILYYEGDESVFSNDFVAVVGTRKPSAVSLNMCESVAGLLRERDHLGVVSGLALGIDREIMWRSLDRNLPLIGVMGTGFEKSYPYQNKDLYREMRIRENCLLVTEMRPFEPIGKWSFPKRNRIITGLAETLIVMEAPLESGAMSSARHAITQGREVFVFEHESQVYNSGGKKLLEDGAYRLNQDDFKNPGKMIHVSELFPKDFGGISQSLALLSKMELEGKVKEKGGGYFEFF
ncbi:MAG: DNA-protecting protein DprA [Leptospiraceae bacterium]|nr:DNA-protecting protein DprA [Leptospiraceae bacterium]